jgi:hypothetical protein
VIKPAHNPAYPGTVTEAVDRLYAEWLEQLLAKIRDTEKDDLDLFHFSLGTEIRNSLGLWDNNWDLLEDAEAKGPDEAAGEVIYQLWRRLHRVSSGWTKSRKGSAASVLALQLVLGLPLQRSIAFRDFVVGLT